jgi:hypothetical protein
MHFIAQAAALKGCTCVICQFVGRSLKERCGRRIACHSKIVYEFGDARYFGAPIRMGMAPTDQIRLGHPEFSQKQRRKFRRT